MERDYLPEVPNAEAYPVDYRIEGSGDVPLFLYGVPRGSAARSAYFHWKAIRIAFEDQVVATWTHVGGGMVAESTSFYGDRGRL